jgi:hypothetical protein
MDVRDDVAGPERLARLVPLVRAMRPPSGAEPAAGTRVAAEAKRFESGEILVLPTGEIADDLTLSRASVETLLRAALAASDDTPSVVWVRGDSELAVHTARTRVALGPGVLLIGVPVECDQTGPAEVTVPFALGSKNLNAGLLMAAQPRPDGPALLVEQWGAVLTAAVYRAVLDVVSAAAATAGVDTDGTALLPGAVSTDGERLTIIPQARHAIDRQQLL